jgi:hypothetical protein
MNWPTIYSASQARDKCPQSTQSALAGKARRRISMHRKSSNSSWPRNGSPKPLSTLSDSIACSEPNTPTTGASTPLSLQLSAVVLPSTG